MSPGTRVVILDSCPWPERRGLNAVIVAPPEDGTYPQPARSEVLLLIDDDPLHATYTYWTCVMNVRDVRPAPVSQEGTPK